MLGGLGQCLLHLNIRVELTHLYRPDGIYMSDEGNEIFLRDFQLGLHTALGLPCGR